VPLKATVELKVKDLDIPFLLPYLPFPPPVKIDSGRLATALELGYRIDAKSGPGDKGGRYHLTRPGSGQGTKRPTACIYGQG